MDWQTQSEQISLAWKSVMPDGTATHLLRACLLKGQAAESAWQYFEQTSGGARAYFEDDYYGLKGLLAFIAFSLNAHGVQASPEFLTYARVALVREELRSKIYYEVLADLCSRLQQNSIDHVLLKGAALGTWLYPSPYIRHNHGIDLLVSEQDLNAVISLLIVAGFKKRSGSKYEYEHSTGLPVTAHTKVLHHPYLQDKQADIQQITIEGTPAKTLSLDSHLHQIIGNAPFSGSNSNLRWIVDVFYIVGTNQVDWSEFVNAAQRAGLGLFYAEVLDYMNQQFATAVPSRVLAELRNDAHNNMHAILFTGLLTALRTHRRVWQALVHSSRLRAKFIVFSLLPPTNFLRWRYDINTKLQIFGWYMKRPLRIISRLFGRSVQLGEDSI